MITSPILDFKNGPICVWPDSQMIACTSRATGVRLHLRYPQRRLGCRNRSLDGPAGQSTDHGGLRSFDRPKPPGVETSTASTYMETPLVNPVEKGREAMEWPWGCLVVDVRVHVRALRVRTMGVWMGVRWDVPGSRRHIPALM